MTSDGFDHDPSLLGDLEREVLRLVWRRAPVTADTVRRELNLGHKESTIRTVLHRLEKKGYLKHSIDNRTYLYCAVRPHREVAAMAVNRIADWLYQGSLRELIAAMIDKGDVDSKHLKKYPSQGGKARQARK
jgi:BlaI family penicillinase repressor